MSFSASAFTGSFPALATPFNTDGSVDEKGFADFVEWQISEGTNGLVPMGTTGESPTVTHEEHKRVVDICIEVSAGRVPVIAGAGSNNTAAAIEFAQHGEKAGANALLVVTPYYNKPNQRGMFAHFDAVAKSTSLPIILYNVPGRSIVDISPETVGELAKVNDNIVGIKDATGDVARASLQRATCGADFIQFTGEDGSALGHRAHGGVGCISVTANVAPRLCSEFQAALAAGNRELALELQDRLMPLHTAMFLEPSPGGAKYGLELLGKMKNIMRLPIVPISTETEQRVRAAMVHAGLLN
ncbi:4-hydroxy-tetrahydrodipicolinate synthase [Ahrensia sp. R2A130]|uniref:4-hydroxy-tetrahydrodipicolinate synthase n=1 Tax=Ahrensia sp. R2A130 TaxID=744979 RepID=UPI0001E0A452|nr:4-hydroxy-tetrahydrodipicolinate synthase [Ahrensia sp. R2A130]EFL90666.1 dihydrodipicolinate synthase [Ahrensia sp. R2A130]